MLQYIFLLLTRFGTVLPLSVILVKLVKYFEKDDREFALDRTAKGLTLIITSTITESILFGIYDIYKITSFVDNPSPLWLVILWCTIRATLVAGVWILFSVLYGE